MKLQSSITAVAALALLGVSHAQAATVSVYNSDGFDTRFATNTVLQGQDATQGPWQITQGGTSTAIVTAGVGVGGTNAVKLTTTAGQTDTEWLVSKPMLPTALTPKVNVTWDENVTKTSVAGLQFGPFLGVEVFDVLSTPGTIKQVGAFGVDATTGELLVLESVGGTSFFTTLDSDATVPFSSYNSLGISTDYTAKTYTVTLGGVALQTLPFVDQTATAFTDAPLATRFVSYDTEHPLSQGTANFDNYIISVTTVPEPTTIFGFASIGLLLSKRRR